MARSPASELGRVLAEALGIDPLNCLSLKVNWKGGEFVMIDARIIMRDVDEKLLVENGEPVIALRTWTEGRFKRFEPIFGDAREDGLPTLYERIDGADGA